MVDLLRDVGGWTVRWDDKFAARAVAEGDWPNRTVTQFAQSVLDKDPDRIILIDGGRHLTIGEIYAKSQRLAGWFTSLGLPPGSVVSFQLPNWWEAAVINIAAAMTGLVVNPILPINRDAEVTHMLGAARSRLCFVPGRFGKFDYLAMMERVLPRLADPPEVVVVRGDGGAFKHFHEVLKGAQPLLRPVPVDPNAVKLLMYTSGTTGRPKAVLHSHNTLSADSFKMTKAMKLTEDDVIFSPSPLTHVSGYLWALHTPFYGNIPAVMIDVWQPDRAFDLMKRYGCTFVSGATPFLQGLVRHAQATGDRLDRLRYFICGGAAVPPELIYEAAETFPNCIPWRTFGATEAPTITCCPSSRDNLWQGAETDGQVYRAEIKVVDPVTGVPVQPGAEGEVLVREPSMALGYALMEDNQCSYDEDGFFRMGDLIRIIEGDLLVCTGRKKDLIIRSGENISAKEIEDVLFRSPRIEDVAVVSMPSPRTGEAICAFVVPAQPGDRVDLNYVSVLIEAAGLARQKTPEHVEVVAELPKTPSGKVRKDVLRGRAKTFSSQPSQSSSSRG
jgi:acyl-CoA synthetase (AMP-forming)/AMP-acid ligase II